MPIVQLKVKITSLAAEARIIRREERKRRTFINGGTPKRSKLFDYPPTDEQRAQLRAARLERQRRAAAIDPALKAKVRDEYLSLKHHRRVDVREESRCAGLAYGFLRGTPYRCIESTCRTQPRWDRVESIVKRFGDGRNDLDVESWRKAT